MLPCCLNLYYTAPVPIYSAPMKRLLLLGAVYRSWAWVSGLRAQNAAKPPAKAAPEGAAAPAKASAPRPPAARRLAHRRQRSGRDEVLAAHPDHAGERHAAGEGVDLRHGRAGRGLHDHADRHQQRHVPPDPGHDHRRPPGRHRARSCGSTT